MARHNNAGPTRVLFPALVMIGIVWDPAATRRLAIVMLIIAIVCFRWPFFSFYAAADRPTAATFAIAFTES